MPNKIPSATDSVKAHKSEEAADNLRVKLRDYLAENESLQKQLEQATSTKGRKQS